VPFGFICGFPVQHVASELWGYVSGQAATHAQGAAVAAAVLHWGGPGCTELPFPVCKTGYKPFDPVTGAKMFGCARHSAERKSRIKAAGLRPGWASFDQWPRGETPQQPQSSRRPAMPPPPLVLPSLSPGRQ
jgi:hypothetical protein